MTCVAMPTEFENWLLSEFQSRFQFVNIGPLEVTERDSSGVGIFVTFDNSREGKMGNGPICIELAHPQLQFGATAMLWLDDINQPKDLEVVTFAGPWPESELALFSTVVAQPS